MPKKRKKDHKNSKASAEKRKKTTDTSHQAIKQKNLPKTASAAENTEDVNNSVDGIDPIILTKFKEQALKILKNDREGTALQRLDKLKVLIDSQIFSTALVIDRSENSSYRCAYHAVRGQRKDKGIFKHENAEYLLKLDYPGALFTSHTAGVALNNCNNLKKACGYVFGLIDTYSKHIPGQEKWVPHPKIKNPAADTPLSLFRNAALEILTSKNKTVQEQLEQLKALCDQQMFPAEFKIDKSQYGKYFSGKHAVQKQQKKKSPLFEFIDNEPRLIIESSLPLFSRVTKTTLNGDTLEDVWSYTVGLIHQYEEYVSVEKKWVPHPQIEKPSHITPFSAFKQEAAEILRGLEKITVRECLAKLKALVNKQTFETELEIGKLSNANYFKGKDVIRKQFNRRELFEYIDGKYSLKLESTTPLLIGAHVSVLENTNTLEDACNYIIGLVHQYEKHTSSTEQWIPQPHIEHPTQQTPLSLFIRESFQILTNSKKINIQEHLEKLKELVNQQIFSSEFKLDKAEKHSKYWLGYKAIANQRKTGRLFKKNENKYCLRLDYEGALFVGSTAGLTLKKSDNLEDACNYVVGLIHACEKHIPDTKLWIPQPKVEIAAVVSDVDMEESSISGGVFSDSAEREENEVASSLSGLIMAGSMILQAKVQQDTHSADEDAANAKVSSSEFSLDSPVLTNVKEPEQPGIANNEVAAAAPQVQSSDSNIWDEFLHDEQVIQNMELSPEVFPLSSPAAIASADLIKNPAVSLAEQSARTRPYIAKRFRVSELIPADEEDSNVRTPSYVAQRFSLFEPLAAVDTSATKNLPPGETAQVEEQRDDAMQVEPNSIAQLLGVVGFFSPSADEAPPHPSYQDPLNEDLSPS